MTKDQMVGWHQWMPLDDSMDMNYSKLQMAKDREACCAVVHGACKESNTS